MNNNPTARLFNEKSIKGILPEMLKTYFIADKLTKLSQRNRLNDFQKVYKKNNAELWELHRALEEIRFSMKENYESYDYGCGYYYQSYDELCISGFRNTEERIKLLNLCEQVKGKTVLDIGSNTGFLLTSLAKFLKKGVGIEINPYLVETSNLVKNFIHADNITFTPSSFEDYDKNESTFDMILSLANHSTYDGNTQQSKKEYFTKINSLLTDNGLLIFESHPPKIESKDQLAKTIELIKVYFDIMETPQILMKGFLDKDRTYLVARKKQP